ALGAIDRRVVLVVALLLDDLPARAALATDVHERRLLAHDPREAVTVVAEAGRVAGEERRILHERLEGVWILPAVMPREHAAVCDDRARHLVRVEMHEIDAVAHPLVGDAAREFAIQPELEVELRVERPERLGPQPRLPVGVGLANLLHLRAAAPARAV